MKAKPRVLTGNAPNPERLADILPRVLPLILGRVLYGILLRTGK